MPDAGDCGGVHGLIMPMSMAQYLNVWLENTEKDAATREGTFPSIRVCFLWALCSNGVKTSITHGECG